MFSRDLLFLSFIRSFSVAYKNQCFIPDRYLFTLHLGNSSFTVYCNGILKFFVLKECRSGKTKSMLLSLDVNTKQKHERRKLRFSDFFRQDTTEKNQNMKGNIQIELIKMNNKQGETQEKLNTQKTNMTKTDWLLFLSAPGRFVPTECFRWVALFCT